jgi:hypothetical protein
MRRLVTAGCMFSTKTRWGLAASLLILALAAPAGAQTADLLFRNGFEPALNETDLPAEADYCNIQFPSSLTVATGEPTQLIYGQLYEAGATEAFGAPAGWIAQVGYGPSASDPRTDPGWLFTPTVYNVQVGNNDEFQASFLAPAPGTYSYAYRFSVDGGGRWTYCDTDGAGSNGGLTFETFNLGTMTVQ